MSVDHRMPVRVGVRFAHATVQAIADSIGADVLHIKGPAVDPSLLAAERQSLDADVLVRPDHVQPMIEAMRRHGWETTVDFADGSAFEHAATMQHPALAPVDVHRSFPGMGGDPAGVFDHLWQDRHPVRIAGYPCLVPRLTAQRLLLILNAVRGGPGEHGEITRLWTDASSVERDAVRALADEVGAEVALAAAAGNLDDYRGSREHDLWLLLASGQSSPVRLWVARVRAQPNAPAALREAVRLLIPNPRKIALRLGHAPTARDMASAWVQRWYQGVHALRDVARGRAGRTK